MTFVDLLFLEPVSEASVAVTYNGVPIPGRTTVPEGEVITFTLDQPLTEPGRYQVSYEMISFDTDFTTGGFFFTYDPAAGQVARIAEPGSDGTSSNTLLISGLGFAAVAALLGVVVWRIDARRREQYLDDADYYDSSYDDSGYDADEPYDNRYQAPYDNGYDAEDRSW